MENSTIIKKDNKDIIAAINLQKVVVGVNSSSEIVQKTIYDVHTSKHANWFVLDLETGSRGWYLGKDN